MTAARRTFTTALVRAGDLRAGDVMLLNGEWRLVYGVDDPQDLGLYGPALSVLAEMSDSLVALRVDDDPQPKFVRMPEPARAGAPWHAPDSWFGTEKEDRIVIANRLQLVTVQVEEKIAATR